MKLRVRVLVLVVTALVFTLGSCSILSDLFGSEEDRIVRDILSDDQIEILDDLGMTFNSGSNPPNIEGYYRGTDLDAIGDTTGLFPQNLDYIFRFYDQTETELLIDYENISGSDWATGEGAYIFGENDDFTVYIEQQGTSSGVDYTSAYVYSGTYSALGIEDFTFAFILTEKGPDPYGYLMDEDEARVYEESDGMADKVSGFYSVQPQPGAVQPSNASR
jgi:hypothetical protein